MNFFDVLNDPTYSYLVKDLWVRAEVFDKKNFHVEDKGLSARDDSKIGNSISELGLKDFNEVKIGLE